MKKKFFVAIILLLSLLLLSACNEITVNWVDTDGTVLYVEEIEKDVNVPERPLPDDNDEWHYTHWTELSGEDGEMVFRAERIHKMKVIWRDCDGSQLHEETLTADQAIPERALPEDTDGWHYTGWRKEQPTDTQILLIAERVPVKTVIWLDDDGNLLHKQWVELDAVLPTRDLPESNSRWLYEGWSLWQEGNVYTYTMVRRPNPSYLVGNVFRLVAQNYGEAPIGYGSGFVLNDQGWFITYYPVLEEAYTASAIFEIPDPSTGRAYTKFEIRFVSYFDKENGILIGMIENYKKIASHYKPIAFNTQYYKGDAVYSVGYSSETARMEAHGGTALMTVDSQLWRDTYGYKNYMVADSNIIAGGSGGVLLNRKLEVLGISATGIEEDGRFLSAFVKSEICVPLIADNTDKLDGDHIPYALHRDMSIFAEYFYRLELDPSNYKKIESEEGFYFLTENTRDENATEQLYVYHDGNFLYKYNGSWDNGNSVSVVFCGVYTDADRFNKFTFAMTYQYADGSYFYLESTGAEYDSDLDKYLKNYSGHASYGALKAEDIVIGKRYLEAAGDMIDGRIKHSWKIPFVYH